VEEVGITRQLTGNVTQLKLQHFRHIATGTDGELLLCVLERSVAGARYRGAARMMWIDNVAEWSGKTMEVLAMK